MPRYVVNTLHSNHFAKAHATLFREEIEYITRKLKKLAKEIRGVYYNPSLISLGGSVVLAEGKIEFDINNMKVVDTVPKIFNVVNKVEVFYEKSKPPDIVFIANENGIMVTIRVPTDEELFKIRYTIYLPYIMEPGMQARKNDVTVVYKFIPPNTSRKVMKVGNTLAVPLKRELSALGNPNEVDVYLDVEAGEIIIKPKT